MGNEPDPAGVGSHCGTNDADDDREQFSAAGDIRPTRGRSSGGRLSALAGLVAVSAVGAILECPTFTPISY